MTASRSRRTPPPTAPIRRLPSATVNRFLFRPPPFAAARCSSCGFLGGSRITVGGRDGAGVRLRRRRGGGARQSGGVAARDAQRPGEGRPRLGPPLGRRAPALRLSLQGTGPLRPPIVRHLTSQKSKVSFEIKEDL